MTAAAGDSFSVLYRIYIGGKTGTGTYTGTASYTISPNPIPGLTNGNNMQASSPANCSNTPIYDPDKADETTFSLKDSRTNKSYLVRRLKDGNCYMVQNLWLEANTTYVNGSSLGATFTTPEDVTDNAKWADDVKELVMKEGSHSDAATDNADDNTGSYFNWMAATIGTGNYAGEDTLIAPSPNDPNRASDSVCPRGWQLPSSAQYDNANDGYVSGAETGDAINASSPVSSSTGRCTTSGCPSATSRIFNWLSDQPEAQKTAIATIGLSNGIITNSISNRGAGLSVRCILVAQ